MEKKSPPKHKAFKTWNTQIKAYNNNVCLFFFKFKNVYETSLILLLTKLNQNTINYKNLSQQNVNNLDLLIYSKLVSLLIWLTVCIIQKVI